MDGVDDGNTSQWGTTGPDQQPVQHKEKKRVGLGTALAIMLAGSVAAASVTGVVVGNIASPSGNSSGGVSSLDQESVSREVSNDDIPDDSIEAVANKVLPAVVSIRTMSARGGEEGSGSIISTDGMVLTNNHVVAAAADGQGELEVSLNDGSTHKVDFVSSDASTDVALIKIEGVSDLPVLPFGNSDDIQVGQQVVAVGSPLGLSSTVTTGIVSSLNRPVSAAGEGGGETAYIDAIQTDAAINPGNSGGPLVDLDGNLVGMNSVIAALPGSQGQAGSIGLGFAIPSNFAKRTAEQLRDNGEVHHPMLGVALTADRATGEAVVGDVEPGGPADQAGLKRGDVIKKVDDRVIDSSSALVAAIRSHDFGEKVTLQVARNGQDQTEPVEVTLTGE